MSRKLNSFRKLLPIGLSIAFLAASPGLAQAAVDGYVTLGHDQKTYSYSYIDLKDSLVASLVDPNAPDADLWNHFVDNKASIVSLHDDIKGYISFTDVKDALLEATIAGTPFNVNEYTASDVAAPASLPETITLVTQGASGIVTEDVPTDDGAAAYAELKAGIDAKVAAYKALADGDLSTQALVDAAKASGILVDLTGLKDADKTAAQAIVTAADAKVIAAQEVIDAINADVTAPTIAANGNIVTNYQTLTVAFSEKVAGTPTVTVNTVAEPGANVVLAADGRSMTITRTAGFAAGSYAIVVNGLSDVKGNVMAANASVSITKAASFVSDFTFTTTALNATAGSHRVYFTAIDQYGADVTGSLAGALDNSIVATATMGQLPLAITYAPDAGNDGQNYITITDDLIAASTVTVKLTNTVDTVTYTKSKAYSVVAAATVVPTSIVAITPAVGTNITVDDDNQTLTLNVLDQYGNPVEAGNVGNVRWVTSSKTVLAFSGATSLDFETTNNTITNSIDAIAPGTATISVFLAGSTTPNATLRINVGMSALSTLTWANAWDHTVNQEVSTEKLTPNAGAVVTASDLKYVVDTFPAGAAASDIAIVFEDGTAADAGKILVKATTAKAGTYQFRVFTGATPADAGAVVSGTRTLTTTINSTVASMTVADTTANELTAGVVVKKAITFKNVHGEIVNVNAANISVASTANMAVTAYDADGNTLTLGTTATPVATLGFRGTSPATDTVTIVTGAVSKPLTLTTVAAATLTNFDLGTSNATVIVGDKHDVGDGTALDNVMMDDNGDTVILTPVSFSDQYGNAMSVNADAFNMAFTGTTPGTTPVFALYGDKVNGTAALADDAATAVKFIGIKAETGDTTQSVTLQMRNEANTANIGPAKTVAVTVNAARALSTLSTTPTSGNSVVNVPVTFTLSGIDQYGVAVDLDHTKTQLQTLSNVTLGNKAVNGTDSNKSDFTLTAAAAGSYSATVFYSADGTLDAGEKSTVVSLTAGTIASIVDRIEIQPTVTVAASKASADGTYNANTAKVALDGEDADQTVTFTVKAYDANNNEVGISQTSDVVYTVLNNSITSAGTVGFASNVATVDMNTGGAKTFDADDSFTIQATSLNGKTATLVLNLADIDTAAAKNGQYYLASTATGTAQLNTLDVNQSATVHVVGIDQFGKTVNVVESGATVLTSVQDDNSKVANERTASGINIDAKAVGATTLRVMLADGSQLTLPINVVATDAAGPVLTNAITQNNNATTITVTITEPFGAYIGMAKVNTSAGSLGSWVVTGANAADVTGITVASDLSGGGLITITLATAAIGSVENHVAKIDLAQIKDLAGNSLVNGTTAANTVLTLTGGATTWTASLGASE